MELEQKGWYCPVCNFLMTAKEFKQGVLITCDCYEIEGGNMCLSKKDKVVEGKNWYKITEQTQKSWLPVFIKKE